MYPITQQNNINFKGHCGRELIKYGKEQILLTTETAFGRELDTLDYAINYVNKTFPNIKKKRFVVGACSTGEEVWTLKMLKGKDPVEIIGFDLAPKALDIAKNGVYTFYSPNTRKVRLFKDSDGYQDLFLAYSEPKNSNEKRLYEMFHNMFEQIKFSKLNFFKSDKRIYKLKENHPDCTFIKGDIRNLPPEIKEQKCQMFSFRNAFYHLLTYHNGVDREGRDPRLLRPMFDKIFKSINKIMDKDSLFIMGKKENTQSDYTSFIIKALINNGFIPIRHNEEYYNLWIKAKEV